MGKGGLAPWKCCKVFNASVVTVKRSVDQLFMHYFHNLPPDLDRSPTLDRAGGLSSPGPLIYPLLEKIQRAPVIKNKTYLITK